MMTAPDDQKASRLIADLLSDPEKFTRNGSGNSLLKQFLRGYPIDRLGSLLRNENTAIIKPAIWIASELAAAATPFLPEAIALADHPDPYIRHYALEVIMQSTVNTQQGDFARVVEKLNDPEAPVAGKAVSLVAHATDDQLAGSKQKFEKDQPSSSHIAGLSALLKVRSLKPEDIEAMIKGPDLLGRKYGLAAAERLYKKFPHLLEVASMSQDSFIRQRAVAMIKIHEAGTKKQENSDIKH
jgi:hypothetical protein